MAGAKHAMQLGERGALSWEQSTPRLAIEAVHELKEARFGRMARSDSITPCPRRFRMDGMPAGLSTASSLVLESTGSRSAGGARFARSPATGGWDAIAR